MPVEAASKKHWLAGTAGRATVISVGVFFAINLTLLAVKPRIEIKPTDLPVRMTWEWWRTKSFLAEKRAPDVVLFGSSLLMIPTSLVEADYLNQDIDAVKHPHSNFLENKLESISATKPVSCFNFALPGAMISDHYMISKSLFTGKKIPKVIVLGLTLRDFIDSGVDSATSTPTYQFFRHYEPTEGVEHLLNLTPVANLESFYNKVLFLFDKRLELQGSAARALKNYGNSLLTRVSPNANFDTTKLNATESGDGDILGNSNVTEGTFIMHAHQPLPWKDNTREYRKRFASSNERLFTNQLAFFDRFLDFARVNDIKVVVINMPLTENNMMLMPRGMYQKYFDAMNIRAHQDELVFADLNDRNKFQLSDFQDTAHMNGVGGAKLMKAIADTLTNDPTVKTALASKMHMHMSTANKTLETY